MDWNNPPEKPVINGPSVGKIRKMIDFQFTSTDPEGQDVYYYIYWGDGDVEDCIGPYSSGEEIEISHFWSKTGDFKIIAKAMDEYGAKSSQSEFKLKISNSRIKSNMLLFKLIDQFLSRFHLFERLLNFNL